jgi:hypothetical protein
LGLPLAKQSTHISAIAKCLTDRVFRFRLKRELPNASPQRSAIESEIERRMGDGEATYQFYFIEAEEKHMRIEPVLFRLGASAEARDDLDAIRLTSIRVALAGCGLWFAHMLAPADQTVLAVAAASTTFLAAILAAAGV